MVWPSGCDSCLPSMSQPKWVISCFWVLLSLNSVLKAVSVEAYMLSEFQSRETFERFKSYVLGMNPYSMKITGIDGLEKSEAMSTLRLVVDYLGQAGPRGE